MKKQSNKSLKKSLSYFKKYVPIFVVSFVFAIVGSVMTIIGPSKIKDLTNVITDGILLPAGIDIGLFIRTAVLLVVLYAVGALASVIQSFITATVTQKMSKELRTDIDVKINKLPLSYFDTNTVGDLLSRVTNDVDTLAQALGSNLANIVSSITLFVGVVIMMFVTNWILALVTIATSTLGMIASMSILKHSRKLFSARQKYMGVVNGHVEETYTNYKIVKSYTASEMEKTKFKKESGNIYDVTWKAQFLASSMGPIFSFVGDLAYVLIFVVGVSIIINGAVGVTLGTLMSFVIYAKLFSQPLRTLGQSMSSIQQAAAASERVFELLEQDELESEQDKTTTLSKVKGNVNFNNVNFSYVPGKTIINNFSASLKKGQKVAIVGPTGAGKTTIVNLLMRFYEVNSGSISIDGVNTKDITRENVHNLFDMILQDTWLFKGTVRENLVFNKQNVTEKELDKACKAVGLTSFIATLPNKYDTVIDGESSLSEGQKQQMTIARAIIRNAPLLILDEATSNIDTRTELAIQQAMDNLTKGRTSFVIAHRLSTIRDADVILVMDKGDIVEMGTHKELLAKNGLYANIYNSQFAKVS